MTCNTIQLWSSDATVIFLAIASQCLPCTCLWHLICLCVYWDYSSYFIPSTNSRFLNNNKYGVTSNDLGNKSIFAFELSDNLHAIISQAAIESWI